MARFSTPALARTARIDGPAVEIPASAPQRPLAPLRRGMRVGYVMDRFPRGSHDFALQEILELESRGIEVHIFSLGGPDGRVDDTSSALARLGSPVHYFLGDVGAAEAADSPSRLNETPFAPDALAPSLTGGDMTSRQAQWMASVIATRGIEHLHAHGATVPTEAAREAGRLTGLGYSFTADADSLHEGADSPSLRERILDARFVVTVSDFDRRRVLSICGPGAADKLHRIPVGVNPEEYRFSGTECRDSDSILAMAPLIEKSGFTDLIEAVGILRDRGRVVRLTIIGQGEFEATLRAQIDRLLLADTVRLISGVSHRDLAMLMRVHAVMVLPWLAADRDRDRLAHVVLEAMSVGLPVLSTDLPGIRELIDDGVSGRVISPHDPKWLAGALETLFASLDLREWMARRARSKVERRFTASRNASRLAKLFLGAVARKELAT